MQLSDPPSGTTTRRNADGSRVVLQNPKFWILQQSSVEWSMGQCLQTLVAARLRGDSDHNPREGVTKDLLPDDGVRDKQRFAARRHKVNYHPAVAPTQHTRGNLDNPIKGGRVANRPNAFRKVPFMRSEVHRSPERTRQRLELLWMVRSTEALRVPRAVEVIAYVSVPIPIASRHHDEILAFLGTPDPQR
jgi:hypothetical protein